MRQSVSHYQVLGVAPHASHDEIRRAYRALVKRHHPDANPDAPAEARARVAQIIAAWEVLGDPAKRQAYDWAIGTTPRPNPADPFRPDEPDDLFDDEPEVPVRQRPSDVLVVIPVFLLLAALATFVFSTMSESTLLRTLAILMAPVTAGAFIAAPLFMMLRARSRNR